MNGRRRKRATESRIRIDTTGDGRTITRTRQINHSISELMGLRESQGENRNELGNNVTVNVRVDAMGSIHTKCKASGFFFFNLPYRIKRGIIDRIYIVMDLSSPKASKHRSIKQWTGHISCNNLHAPTLLFAFKVASGA